MNGHTRRLRLTGMLAASLVVTPASAQAVVALDASTRDAGAASMLTLALGDAGQVTRVEVGVPGTLDSVSVRPIPGWSARVEDRPGDQPSLAVWELTGDPAPDDTLLDLSMLVSPLPGGTLELPVRVTRTDGSVRHWGSLPGLDPSTSTGTLTRPAPSLEVTDARIRAAVSSAPTPSAVKAGSMRAPTALALALSGFLLGLLLASRRRR